VITGDVRGTSFDVSLIAGGAPTLAAQATLDFGLVVRTPMIEISTIGAGALHARALLREVGLAPALVPLPRRDPGVAFTGRRVEHALGMNYAGQSHTVTVPLPLTPDGAGMPRRAIVAASFEASYAGAYGRLLPGVPVRMRGACWSAASSPTAASPAPSATPMRVSSR